MKKLLSVLVALVAVAIAVWFVMFCTSDVDVPRGGEDGGRRMLHDVIEGGGRSAGTAPIPQPARDTAANVVGEPKVSPQVAQTDDGGQDAAEEKAVDDFDAETDRWMDAEKTKPPTMAEIDAFVAKFRNVPKERKEECLQRALNLVPDENVMLLIGVLMDKSQDREFVELVYNDILNRSEDVKKTVFSAIIKDKAHPCWADTAWILDVTGERPVEK